MHIDLTVLASLEPENIYDRTQQLLQFFSTVRTTKHTPQEKIMNQIYLAESVELKYSKMFNTRILGAYPPDYAS